jgi:hypothetical protein
LGVSSLHYYCGPRTITTTTKICKALVRILRNRREIQYVVLTTIKTMAQENPTIFILFLSDFFVKSTDPIFNRILKLEILTSLCSEDNIQLILRELQLYIKDSNETFVISSVKAIGRAADAIPTIAGKCMEGLMHLIICTKAQNSISIAVVVIRQLLQQNIDSKLCSKILHQLAKMLIMKESIIIDPLARSSIVWLIGEFYDFLPKVSPDLLRVLSAGFVEESIECKNQILNFAIKLSIRLPNDEKVQLLMTYILEMSRYDIDTDLRDHSRLMTSLVGLAPSDDADSNCDIDENALEEFCEHSMGIALSNKLPPVTLLGSVDSEGLSNLNLGSLSSIVGYHISGYLHIKPWNETKPNPSIRNSNDITNKDLSDGKDNKFSGANFNKNSFYDDDDYVNNNINSNNLKSSSSSSSSSSSGSSSSSSCCSSSSSRRNSSTSEDSGDESDGNSSSSSNSSNNDDSSEESSEINSNQPARHIGISQQSSIGVTRRPIRKVSSSMKKVHSNEYLVSNIYDNILDVYSQSSPNDVSEAVSIKEEARASPFDLLDCNENVLEVLSDPSVDNKANSRKNSSDPFFPVELNKKNEDNLLDYEEIIAINEIKSNKDFVINTNIDNNSNNVHLNNDYNTINKDFKIKLKDERVSDDRIILRPELSGGLYISLVYRFSENITPLGSTNVFVVLKNLKEYQIRYLFIIIMN